MATTTPRRVRVERGIYKRTGTDGKDQFEIGYRDAQQTQRWQRVDGGIMAARAALGTLVSRPRGQRAPCHDYSNRIQP